MTKGYVLPSLSNRIFYITEPTWLLDPPDVDLKLSDFSKNVTPNHIYRELHRSAASNEYRDFQFIYTDGSKSDHGIGAAAVWSDATRTATLPRGAFIFTADKHAIYLGKDVILENPSANFIISDLLSTLQKMKTIQYHCIYIRRLRHEFDVLRDRNQEVQLCWVPGHAGVASNESADEAARVWQMDNCR